MLKCRYLPLFNVTVITAINIYIYICVENKVFRLFSLFFKVVKDHYICLRKFIALSYIFTSLFSEWKLRTVIFELNNNFQIRTCKLHDIAISIHYHYQTPVSYCHFLSRRDQLQGMRKFCIICKKNRVLPGVNPKLAYNYEACRWHHIYNSTFK